MQDFKLVGEMSIFGNADDTTASFGRIGLAKAWSFSDERCITIAVEDMTRVKSMEVSREEQTISLTEVLAEEQLVSFIFTKTSFGWEFKFVEILAHAGVKVYLLSNIVTGYVTEGQDILDAILAL